MDSTLLKLIADFPSTLLARTRFQVILHLRKLLSSNFKVLNLPQRKRNNQRPGLEMLVFSRILISRRHPQADVKAGISEYHLVIERWTIHLTLQSVSALTLIMINLSLFFSLNTIIVLFTLFNVCLRVLNVLTSNKNLILLILIIFFSFRKVLS